MNIFVLSSILIAAFLLSPSGAYAVSPPQSLSPSDGSEVSDTSPKLSWQYTDACPSSGSCFLAEVDDSPDFGSPLKSTYTNNTYYTPQDLNEGVWYWRVKGKDSSGNWSEWSSTNFTVSSTAIVPSPSSSSSPSPVPSGSSPPEGSTSNSSQFTVSGVPSSANVDQSFSVHINLSLPSSPNTLFYLKGAFQNSGSSNYFGQTRLSGDFIKNSDSYNKQFPVTTDGFGNWSGDLTVMGDGADSGYTGSGGYIFKVGRYSISGSGPSWSNETNINMIGSVITASSTPKASIKSTPKPSSSSSPRIGSINSPQSFSNSTVSRVTSGNTSLAELPSIASVAGEATGTAFSESDIRRGDKFINWWFVGAGILTFALTCGLIVKTVKKRYYTPHDFREQI